MLKLRKGKKIYKQYETTFDAADDIEMLGKIYDGNEQYIKNAQRQLRQNCITMAIIGAQIRFGKGWILEN